MYEIPYLIGYYCDGHGNIFSTKKGYLKMLTPHAHYGRSDSPYMRIKLGGKNRLVHRVLCSIKLGIELLSDEHVNHLDGNTQNNNLDNLKVVTHQENVEHAVKNGLYCSGEECYNRHNKLHL